MKILKALALIVALTVSPAFAQASHSVALTWTASPDAGTTGTVNVYRSTSTCPVSGATPNGFTILASKVSGLTLHRLDRRHRTVQLLRHGGCGWCGVEAIELRLAGNPASRAWFAYCRRELGIS